MEIRFLLWQDTGEFVGVEVDRDIKIVGNEEYICYKKEDRIKFLFKYGSEIVIDKFYDNMFYRTFESDGFLEFKIVAYIAKEEIYRASSRK